MLEITILGLLLGLILTVAGVLIIYYLLKRLLKIEMYAKWTTLYILLQFLGLIIGLLFIIFGLTLVIYMGEFTYIILSL